MLRLLAILSILSALGLSGCSTNDIPPAGMTAMRNADQYELLSLDPMRPTTQPVDAFHGRRVLGRMTVVDQTKRNKLTEALRAGARENDGMVAMCFNPRHGIHVVYGDKVVDLVICFECFQVEVFEDGQQSQDFLVSDSPQLVFDDVLRTAGVPLPEKHE